MLEKAVKEAAKYLQSEYGMRVYPKPSVGVRSSCSDVCYDTQANMIRVPHYAYDQIRQYALVPQAGFVMRAVVNAYQNQVRAAQECNDFSEDNKLGYGVSIEGPAIMLQQDYVETWVKVKNNPRDEAAEALFTARLVTALIGVKNGIERMAVNPMEPFEKHMDYAARICRVSCIKPHWDFMKMISS